MGYSPWGHKELDTTELLSLSPVFLPGKFHKQRILAGYSPWGHKELDTTERLSLHKRLTSDLETHTD